MTWRKAADAAVADADVHAHGDVQRKCMSWQDAVKAGTQRAATTAPSSSRRRVIVNDPRELLMSWQEAVRTGPSREPRSAPWSRSGSFSNLLKPSSLRVHGRSKTSG
ncbi:hypothetical protein SMMN14_09699 [Sphaerulina musiva]